jgi:DNA-binding transcriptional MerR regulator
VTENEASGADPSGWALDELSARAEARLAELGLRASADGRVAPALDPRTVRYYQSLGILDRPQSYSGHKARYGSRHLLQLLAVKALQQYRLSLAEIQERLYGRSDAELEAVVSMAAASVPKGAHPVHSVPVTLVREVVLAPGLKLVADEAWSPGEDPERLVETIRAALKALATRKKET